VRYRQEADAGAKPPPFKTGDARVKLKRLYPQFE